MRESNETTQQYGIDDVIKKLKERGINEGKQQAESLITDAQKEADAILEEAKKSADSIIDDAKREAKKIKTHLDHDLKKAAEVGLEAFAQAVEKAIVTPTIDESLDPVLKNPTFIEKTAEQLIKAFVAKGLGENDIDLLLPGAQKESLEKHFAQRLTATAKGGPSIKFTDEVSAGIKVSPRGNGFTIDLSKDGFREVFSQFVSPRFRQLFFPGVKH